MLYTLPQAIYDEFNTRRDVLGIKQIVIDHNYDTRILPQQFLPSIVINVINMPSEPTQWIDGKIRAHKTLIVTCFFQNYDVDFTYSSQDVIDLQLFSSSTNFADQITRVFSDQRWVSPKMIALRDGENNMICKTRGGNVTHLYTNESKLVHCHDINISVYITYDDNRPVAPLEGYIGTIEVTQQIG